ncbi:glycosyltransferase [Streptococcus oriscaviae]|uniref:Glycosyltransferase n=1 Tax=Streptococcus oriscaviae TaxID=2781599 RepID=A0ABX7YLF7_9STRE|nr:glycosyltransferase [Streptococcus oriscaviae]QUE54318.1 glycosyltransferase [Streptococcus oriscaviae]
MNILHYTIGFGPERTGGLVKYAQDIMEEQIRQGHEVSALYPASQLFFGKKVAIKKGAGEGIQKYKLVNSLPLALFGGIKTPEDFMVSCDPEPYRLFLQTLQPDVIHVHSLIGLHKEFFEVANSLKIRMVFTAHDYYGLAPLPTFYYNGRSFDEDNSNLAWNILSADALSTDKLRIFQSSLYPTIRKVMKQLGKNPKHKAYQAIETIEEKTDYASLRNYYLEIFSKIDCIHFNSELCKEVYTKNVSTLKQLAVCSITNSSIEHRTIHRPKREKCHLAYIGPDEEYKGYFDFLELCQTLDNNQFEIFTYGHVPNDMAPSFVHQMGRFSQNETDAVYQNIDILVVPSKWKETFGLVILEALSYGVTVYASEHVGAKDLLESETIFSRVQELKEKLAVQPVSSRVKLLNEHVDELLALYAERENK